LKHVLSVQIPFKTTIILHIISENGKTVKSVKLIDKQANMIHSSTLSKRLIVEKMATFRCHLSENCTYEHQQTHFAGWRIISPKYDCVLSHIEETEVITRIIMCVCVCEREITRIAVLEIIMHAIFPTHS